MTVALNNDKRTEIVVALVGNPNSGKTTVFNELTGSRQHVGNWPGVTVERKEGIVLHNGRTLRIVDLPGIYSLSAYSLEETIARDFLIHNKVDVIVNVVDASNLERNLYLTTQLLELGIGAVVALNMIDMAEKMGLAIDTNRFAQLLSVEVVSTVASRGQGMSDILEKAIEVAECAECDAPRATRHNPEIEHEIEKLEQKLGISPDCSAPRRWLIVKALEGDAEARRHLAASSEIGDRSLSEIDATRRHLEHVFGDDLETVIADGRYGFVGGLIREVVSKPVCKDRFCTTNKIDDVVLNRYLGIPLFLALMWLTFKLTFDVGGLFTNFIEHGVAALGNWAAAMLPPGPLSSLIVDGAIAGVGGVIVFVPNIAMMFVMISLLEDSGYMARAAFLMDRAMHLLGLHGKSFIPLMMGFGCNVPAVMAARTLENREDRILTILITPLISCTARLPIYVLFTGAFFSHNGAWVIFSLYAVGVLLAVASGKLFRKTLFSKSASPFVMELPPYRVPTLKGTLIHVWERSSVFLTKAGTVILAASVVIWALGSLPWDGTFASEKSAISRLGHLLEPVVRPIGMDWRAAVALLFGLGAKEVVVSTLGVLYGHSQGGTEHIALRESLRESFTPLTAYTFMLMSLIYVPCVATIAAIRRETNSWKWTTLVIGYSLGLAYGLAFLVYRMGLLTGVQ